MKLIKRTPWGFTIHALDGRQTGAMVGKSLNLTGWYRLILPTKAEVRIWTKRGICYAEEV